MNTPLSTIEQPSNRRAARGSFLMKAVVRFPATGETGEVRVRNLSDGGMMADGAILAERGVDVEIELKKIGWVPGTVAWVEQGRFGIAFTVPIVPADVTAKTSSFEKPRYLEKLDRAPPSANAGKLRGV